MTHAMTRGNPLGPYSAAVFLDAGSVALLFYLEYLFHEASAGRGTGKFQRIFQRARSRAICSDFSADVIWGIGTVFNLVAASFTGVAISYAIGQSAPMVAALWGILAWKEFENSGPRAKAILA